MISPFDPCSRLVPGLSALGGISSLPPDAAPGLVICHDASVGGLTVVGGKVNAFAAQTGGSAYDLLQASADSQPSTTTIGGITVPIVEYDAGLTTNDFIAVASAKSETNRLHDGSGVTAIWPISFVSPPGANTQVLATRTSNYGLSLQRNANGTLSFYVRAPNGNVLVNATTATAVPDTCVITYRMSVAFGYCVRINAVCGLSGALAAAPNSGDSQATYRFGRAATTASANSAHMGDALYSTVHADATVAKLERYWGNRLGITL